MLLCKLQKYYLSFVFKKIDNRYMYEGHCWFLSSFHSFFFLSEPFLKNHFLNSPTLTLSTLISLQPHRTSFYPLSLPSEGLCCFLDLEYSSWRSLVLGSFLSLRYQLKYYLSFKRHLSLMFPSTKVSQSSSITSHALFS